MTIVCQEFLSNALIVRTAPPIHMCCRTACNQKLRGSFLVRFAIRRLIASVPVLLVVTIVVFLLLKLTPGDPAVLMLGQDATPAAVAQLHRELGLDRPLPEQYWSFVVNLVHGDLGRSYDTHQLVTREIGRAFLATAELTFVAIAISIIVGVPLGVISAMVHHSKVDGLIRVALLIMVSMPTFWLGLLLIYGFAVRLGVLPSFGREGLRSLILPSLTLATFSLAIIVRMTRSSLLEVTGSDYIRTARAKGLASWRVIIQHALKNALIPVITIIGLQLGTLLSGAALTETVFAWPGWDECSSRQFSHEITPSFAAECSLSR